MYINLMAEVKLAKVPILIVVTNNNTAAKLRKNIL